MDQEEPGITRDEWSDLQKRCWVCGWREGKYKSCRFRLDTHEIARGPHRRRALREPSCWVRVCNVCHDEMDDYAIWPIARQLALKKMRDPGYCNCERVNLVRGRSPHAITEEDVGLWVDTITSLPALPPESPRQS